MILTGADRRTVWVLAVALIVSYAYFYQGGGWNQNSRFAMVRAIVEHRTLRIDRYAEATGDRAHWRGHYYSDKAPGTSLLAVPPAAMAALAARAAGIDPASTRGVVWTSYIATIATSGAFTAIAALTVFWLTRTWNYSRGAAIFAATAYGVAGPAWCYATLFMGHGVTAGCLMLAFAAALGMRRSDDASLSTPAWLLGLSGGWAVVSEFQAAIPLALIVALAVWDGSPMNRQRLKPAFIGIISGGAITAVVLFAYNARAFGSPLHLGYASEEGFEQLHHGLFGITYPAWWRVREILVGSYRGLLPIAPLVALTPIGFAVLGRTPDRRRAAVVAAAIPVYYLLLNASYFYWEGGWAYGPRQFTPALPFLALGLAPLWDHGRVAGRVVLMAAWIWGTAVTLVAVSTTPQPPASLEAPVQQLLWPAFRDGDLSLNNQGFTDFRADPATLRDPSAPHVAWNLGETAGLKGRITLLPLIVVWAVAAALLI